METAPRPSAEDLATLEPFERFSFALADFANRNESVKAATAAFLRTAGMKWVYYASRHLTHLVGFRALSAFKPRRGVILACNHRSFFDMYLVTCWLYRETSLLQRTYFPVRSEFFYERPAGVAVNLIMSMMAMYPPVFRDPKKRGFNNFGLARLVELLDHPGTVVGMHPEGRRNLSEDPYALLPAQPGLGRLIMTAKPDVVPVFVNGLLNDLPEQVRSNLNRTGKPIIIVAGEPLDLSNFYDKPNRLRTQKQVADHVLDEIRKLGEVERALRVDVRDAPRVGPITHS
ncbi:MAG: 1-acyl-sn-glycerol-3-phosphate acyltransferase [Myxococcales bacterium]|nr:1-acyl-sn-glycerol-3-phosphate acyltransferase [Myxococcales bacterium]